MQRLVLEQGYETLQKGGFTRDTLDGQDMNIYVGNCQCDWTFMVDFPHAYSEGNLGSVTMSRLSYIFGMKGPCFTIDSACSSALVANNSGCVDLMYRRQHMSDGPKYALSMGINLNIGVQFCIGLCGVGVITHM